MEYVIVRTTFSDGLACTLTTPNDIEAARIRMRAQGIESLPILRDGDVETGRRLRAEVTGVLSKPVPEPRQFVLIDDCVYWLHSDRAIAEAQDAMVEEGIEITAIHSTDACCSSHGVLVARQFVVLPYTKTYADDHSESTYAIVRARSVKHAIELVTCRGGGLIEDECWWSKDANVSGDTVERSDATCFYMMWSCDCGDDDCQDEKSPHESQTETIVFSLGAAAGPTREFCLYLNNGREPAVEYLET